MAISKATAPKVAIVHDWLTNLGGAERVVLAMHEAYPMADLYTSAYNPAALPQFASYNPTTSFLQNWPLAKTKHQLYAKLRQLAFEGFDFSSYDIVISSSTAEAKGIITTSETKHISYIHTPTRYYWSHYEDYLAHPGFGWLSPIIRNYFSRNIEKLRRWDFAAAQRADIVLANSKTVQTRIKKYYHRDSMVVNPPVDIHRFSSSANSEGDYFLVVSRLIPYKRIDLVVEAFNKNGRNLHIVGNGSELTDLKNRARSNISFLTGLDDDQVTQQFQGARAFIFPTEEDFGITPVEAMAAGKPVIAFGRGGATETVIDGVTGAYFSKQTIASLNQTIESFDKKRFDKEVIQARAAEFSKDNFIKQLTTIVNNQTN